MSNGKLVPLLGFVGVVGLTAYYYLELEQKGSRRIIPIDQSTLGHEPTPAETIPADEPTPSETIPADEPENLSEELEWLPNEYGRYHFKQFMQNKATLDEYNPLENQQLGGLNTWMNDSKLKLGDDDCLSKWLPCNDTSGFMHFRVKNNYKIVVRITAHHYNYFHDAVTSPDGTTLGAYARNLGKDESNSLWSYDTAAQVQIPMYGGDYLSIDIDEEKSGIYGFRIYSNGVKFDTSKNPDADVYITLEKVYYKNLNYNATALDAEDGSIWGVF